MKHSRKELGGSKMLMSLAPTVNKRGEENTSLANGDSEKNIK
jgi:hypothetical protein